MAEAIVLATAESLLGKLALCAYQVLRKLALCAFEEIKSCWQVNEDLQKLINTIKIIKAGVLDPENRQDRRQPHSALDTERLRRLKKVLYDADDFFDEVFTSEATRETLAGKEKLVEFFSMSSPVVLPIHIAGKIKEIGSELDGIIKDMDLFIDDLRSSDQTMSSTAIDERETISIPADEVIDREKDVSKISEGRTLDIIVGENSTECSGLVEESNDDGVRNEKSLDLSSSLLHLDHLEFTWPHDDDGKSEWKREGIDFECSQLPSNLKILKVDGFLGHKLPEWSSSFNNLLEVHLHWCGKCRYLPSFGRHPRLRVLHLIQLSELEYIEVEEDDDFVAETHFPCLQELVLWGLHKLKAWSPRMEKLGQQFQLQHTSSPAVALADFRSHPLYKLNMLSCSELMSMSFSPADATAAAAAATVAGFPRFYSLFNLEIHVCNELSSMPLPVKGTADINLLGAGLRDPLRMLLYAEDGARRAREKEDEWQRGDDFY